MQALHNIKEKKKMKMKQWSVILVVVLMAVVSTAPAALAAIAVSGDAYVGIFDKYLWRGENLSGGKSVIQSGVDLSSHGFTLSYWSNLQTHSKRKLTETDITLDYSFDINKMFSASVGNIYYGLEGTDTNELYAGLSANTLLSPALKVYYDYDQAKDDGYFITFAIGHSFTLTKKMGLNLGALVSYNGGSDFSVGPYHNWHDYELSASIDYALTDQLTLSPSFLYTAPISGAARGVIDNQALAGLNLALSF